MLNGKNIVVPKTAETETYIDQPEKKIINNFAVASTTLFKRISLKEKSFVKT
jgi:hypothetical protein